MAIVNGFMNKLGQEGELGEGYIEVSPTSLTLNSLDTPTGILTVTKVGDGAIEISSSNPDICSTSISDNTITCTLQNYGVTTLTITTNSTMHLSASTTVQVTCVAPTLSSCTPAQIQTIAQGGIASTVWDIGDTTSDITISAFGNGVSATTMKAFIIGFDHNSTVEGTGITFQMGRHSSSSTKPIAFVDTLYGTSTTSVASYIYLRMSVGSYNTGGWASCTMRTHVIPAFMSALPTAWQNVIRKDVTKWTLNSSGYATASTYVTSTTESAFLLATWEVFGARNSTHQYESSHQAQYAYYANGNTKVFYKSSISTDSCIWWLRSPYSSTATAGSRRYTAVGAAGGWTYASANYTYGFAPAFVVG